MIALGTGLSPYTTCSGFWCTTASSQAC
jgi:hypothetical protein